MLFSSASPRGSNQLSQGGVICNIILYIFFAYPFPEGSKMTCLTIRTELWLWHPKTGKGSWHFLTIADEAAQQVRGHILMERLELGLPKRRGWGAVKVRVTIGETTWPTSMFPQGGGSDGYMLPVKAAVRKAEEIVAGDMVELMVELV
jgi:Domain of unknown function (DUF1905)